MSNPTPTNIPTQSGVGLAAIILGAVCIPLAILIGISSLGVSLPVFGIWFFLPVPLLAIALGILASRTSAGIAGALLGLVALLICLGFIAIDRIDGPDIRSQLSHQPTNSLPAGLSMDQLLRATRSPTTEPTHP